MSRTFSERISHHGLSKRRDQLLRLEAPAMKLTTTSRAPTARGATRFGGSPDAPPGFRWPMRRSDPLAFIAQISVRSIQNLIPWPSTGHLLFFYDVVDQPWGFDPRDRSGSAIIYVPDSAAARPTRRPTGKRGKDADYGDLKPCGVRTQLVKTIPPDGNPALQNILSEREHQAYAELYMEFMAGAGDGHHQIGGWPLTIQNDMEIECQLASHGIHCGDDQYLTDPRAAVLAGGASRWQLMLQVATDERLQVMWGDMGMIYFYATAETRASMSFKETWTILQCG